MSFLLAGVFTHWRQPAFLLIENARPRKLPATEFRGIPGLPCCLSPRLQPSYSTQSLLSRSAQRLALGLCLRAFPVTSFGEDGEGMMTLLQTTIRGENTRQTHSRRSSWQKVTRFPAGQKILPGNRGK